MSWLTIARTLGVPTSEIEKKKADEEKKFQAELAPHIATAKAWPYTLTVYT